MVQFFERVLENRPILLKQYVTPHVNDKVWAHAEDEAIESRMMQLAERDSVVNRLSTVCLIVVNYVGCIE